MSCPNDPQSVAFVMSPQERHLGTECMTLKVLGRPKDLEKREAILDAAAKLFAVRGVEGVPIEAIAAAASVSKVTVYASFKDKGALLEAIVRRESDRLRQTLDEISASNGALEDRLIRIGDTLLGALNDPRHVAMDRCMSVAAVQHPDLGRQFFDAGPGHLRNVIADMLADEMASGGLQPSDPQLAAEDLLGLWFGFRAVEKRFMCSEPWPTDRLAAHIRRSIGLFIRAHAPQGQNTSGLATISQ
jgi:TetR/AcrR family transcriptional regulator, mexJK operon transcriptional repressor